ncbi:hypothetical protein MIND_00275000 [Mycena indigotica]|uniref:C2 NT-type domain-containing protein n=1 Tax=Mycena indigotica TaxID=2126181 RepID=A0A8H6WHM2_9AGAR|nr:uncharacterized protein MIND_00275000 [Mycena indigotica]KAF7312609.1 hypothetical protein MIND_00275000 [Mycena indigotica]
MDKLQLVSLRSASQPGVESRLIIRHEEAGMPGKTLGRLYSAAGTSIARFVNMTALGRGYGPAAVAEPIDNFFDGKQEKGVSVHDLQQRRQIPADIVRGCQRLVNFAFRSETPQTQLTAFKKIIALSTRFPGLNTIFSQNDNVVSTANGLFRLWDRPEDTACDARWHFMCEFAAYCVTERSISALIGRQALSALSSAVDVSSGLSVIEHVLNASEYDAQIPFDSHLSIRYLASILRLKGFWQYLQSEVEGEGHIYSGIADKLLRRAIFLLQDLGSDNDAEAAETATSFVPLCLDEEGVDLYCGSILRGLRTHVFSIPSSVANQLWYRNLVEVVTAIRQLEWATRLPVSRQLVLDDIYERHFPFRMKEVEVIVELLGVTTEQAEQETHTDAESDSLDPVIDSEFSGPVHSSGLPLTEYIRPTSTGLAAQLRQLLPRRALFRVRIHIHQVSNVPYEDGELAARWKFKNTRKITEFNDEEPASPRGQTLWRPLHDYSAAWDHQLWAYVQMSIDRNSHELVQHPFKLSILQRVLNGANRDPVLGALDLDLAEYTDSNPQSGPAKGIINRRYLLNYSKTNALAQLSIHVEPVGQAPQFIARRLAGFPPPIENFPPEVSDDGINI